MKRVICNILSGGEEVNFKEFGGRYLSFNFTPADLEPHTLWTKNSLSPIYFETEQKYDTLELNFVFKNSNIGNISRFTQRLLKCNVSLSGTLVEGMTFDCVLKENKLTKVANNWYTLNCKFDAITFGEEVTVELTPETTQILVGGAKKTEAVITFFNSTDSVIPLAGVNGYTVSNLVVGETVVIDGIKKLVLSESSNAWNRTDFIDFPQLEVGENKIEVIGNALVSVLYKERY